MSIGDRWQIPFVSQLLSSNDDPLDSTFMRGVPGTEEKVRVLVLVRFEDIEERNIMLTVCAAAGIRKMSSCTNTVLPSVFVCF